MRHYQARITEDVSSSDFLAKRRMTEITTTLSHFGVEYVWDNFKIRWTTKTELHVLGQRRNSILFSQMHLRGNWPDHVSK